jgi:hypothetical protein
VQVQCDDFVRKVNTATVTEYYMTVVPFWEKRHPPYCEEIVKLTSESLNKASTIRAARVPARSSRAG